MSCYSTSFFRGKPRIDPVLNLAGPKYIWDRLGPTEVRASVLYRLGRSKIRSVQDDRPEDGPDRQISGSIWLQSYSHRS